MAYVPVPKDLSKVKTKVAFNLTKRQIICFAVALILGLPLFFLLKDSAGTSLASVVMIAVMLPCFLFAMYEKHGQPLEVVAKHIIQTKFIAPKERPYQTQNLYAVLERQRKLEKEVSAIAKGTYKKGSGKKKHTGPLSLGGITMDESTHTVTVRGKPVELANKEFQLLHFLMVNAGIVFSRDTLYNRIWGMESLGNTATVPVHINRIREAVEEDPSNPKHILTIWGVGYKFQV